MSRTTFSRFVEITKTLDLIFSTVLHRDSDVEGVACLFVCVIRELHILQLCLCQTHGRSRIPESTLLSLPHGSDLPSSGQPQVLQIILSYRLWYPVLKIWALWQMKWNVETGRVDNVYGDRKLVCTLLPEEEQVAAAVSAWFTFMSLCYVSHPLSLISLLSLLFHVYVHSVLIYHTLSI